MIPINTIQELKQHCDESPYNEFVMRLNGGFRSTKRIQYYKEHDSWYITHEIDDSEVEYGSTEELIEKGYITPEQKDIILKVQEANLKRPSPHNPDKSLADTILGGLIVSRGLLKEEQVNECLREQALLESEGKPVLLGELLVQKGYLTIAQILDVLEQQHSSVEGAARGRIGGKNPDSNAAGNGSEGGS